LRCASSRIEGINRAVISHQDKKEGFYEMIIDGNDLSGVFATLSFKFSPLHNIHQPRISVLYRSQLIFENPQDVSPNLPLQRRYTARPFLVSNEEFYLTRN
jgi:hypothetical protein